MDHYVPPFHAAALNLNLMLSATWHCGCIRTVDVNSILRDVTDQYITNTANDKLTKKTLASICTHTVIEYLE